MIGQPRNLPFEILAGVMGERISVKSSSLLGRFVKSMPSIFLPFVTCFQFGTSFVPSDVEIQNIRDMYNGNIKFIFEILIKYD